MVCLYFHKFFSINMFHLNFYVYGFHTSYFLVHMVFIFIYIFYFLRIFLSNVYFLIPYICHFKNKFFPYISFFPTKLTKIDFVFLFLNMCFFHQCFISPKICFFSIFNMCFLHRYTKLFFSIDFFSNSWIGFSNICYHILSFNDTFNHSHLVLNQCCIFLIFGCIYMLGKIEDRVPSFLVNGINLV